MDYGVWNGNGGVGREAGVLWDSRKVVMRCLFDFSTGRNNNLDGCLRAPYAMRVHLHEHRESEQS